MSSPQVWLITGCSSGFGITIARAVIQRRHIVIASSCNPRKTQELVEEIKNADSDWIELDGCSNIVASAVQTAFKQHSRLGVIVNNADFAHVSTVEDLQ